MTAKSIILFKAGKKRRTLRKDEVCLKRKNPVEWSIYIVDRRVEGIAYIYIVDRRVEGIEL